jgi:hypothetical protein
MPMPGECVDDSPGYFDKTSACRESLLIFAAKVQFRACIACFHDPLTGSSAWVATNSWRPLVPEITLAYNIFRKSSLSRPDKPTAAAPNARF